MASSSSPPPIPLFKVFVAPPEELDDELLRVVHSGYVTQGPKVEAFEEALRAFLQSPRVVTVNSGTSALHLALHLLKRAEGGWPGLQESVDEVLTCPLTCTATNWPILANGLRIKWVDADPATANVCLDDLEAKLSPTTKVIMVVHWGGSPVDLGRLAAIQERCFSRFGFRPAVIEDCAHAFGAEWGGRKLGSHGNFCCFSLQAIKHVTAVDGGVLIAPTQRLFERARLVRWFGIDRERRSGGGDFRMEPPVEEFGFKFHMNDVNATVGEANLRHAPRLLAACRANAEFYQRSLAGLPHVTLLRDLPVGAVSAYWLFTLRVPQGLRASLISHLREARSAEIRRDRPRSCGARRGRAFGKAASSSKKRSTCGARPGRVMDVRRPSERAARGVAGRRRVDERVCRGEVGEVLWTCLRHVMDVSWTGQQQGAER